MIFKKSIIKKILIIQFFFINVINHNYNKIFLEKFIFKFENYILIII